MASSALALLLGSIVAEIEVDPIPFDVRSEAAAHDDVAHAAHVRLADEPFVDVYGIGVIAAVRLHRLLVETAGAGSRAAAADDA
jgi:hypothetical protein